MLINAGAVAIVRRWQGGGMLGLFSENYGFGVPISLCQSLQRERKEVVMCASQSYTCVFPFGCVWGLQNRKETVSAEIPAMVQTKDEPQLVIGRQKKKKVMIYQV